MWNLGTTVRFIVGKEKRLFNVDQAMLFERGEYFQKAFPPNLKEGQTWTMELPGTDPDVICLFIRWLYTGQLGAERMGLKGSIVDYLNLYRLAERWMLKDLKEDVYTFLAIRNGDALWDHLLNPVRCYEAWRQVQDSPIRFIVCRVALDMAYTHRPTISQAIDCIMDEFENDQEFVKNVLACWVALGTEESEKSEYKLGEFPETLKEFLTAFNDDTMGYGNRTAIVGQNRT